MGSNFVEGEASHIVSFDENQEDYFNNIDHSLPRLPSRSGSEATIVSHHQEVVNDGLNIDHFLSRRTSRLGSESEIESHHQEGVNEGHLAMMRNRISQIAPSLRREPAAGENPCIFRLPQRFKNINGKSYEPRMVSIGPYHRGKAHLQIMEHHKWQCLAYFLKRPEDLKLYMENLVPLEMKARECYSETINYLTTSEFLEMMVLDGCFILELLRFLYLVEIEELGEVSHPLARMGRVKLLKIYGDLLLLENQIPSFVLQRLFQHSKMTWYWGYTERPLSFIGINVFSAILGIQYSGDKSRFNGSFLHLLDLVRSIFIPPDHEAMLQDRDDQGFPLEYWYRPFDTIPSVSKLRRAGIKVNPRKDCFLVAEFRSGAIEMPNIILNDLMCSFLVNCVAFEQFYNSSKHFSVYALLLDCLVNTAGDVEYLCDRHVIDNYIGTDVEAASFINILGKDLTFDIDYINLWSLFFNVNEYYQNRLNRQWTSFKREYFNKPWLWISALFALVLFELAFLQTFFSIYAYVHPKN
jgi:hypothetical protein